MTCEAVDNNLSDNENSMSEKNTLHSYISLFRTFKNYILIGQLPRVSREDPERIRVDSVFETLDCSLSVLFL